MSHMFGGAPSAPPPPPPPPTPASPASTAVGSSLEQSAAAAAQAGFGGTLLTGPSGAQQPTTANKSLLGQ